MQSLKKKAVGSVFNFTGHISSAFDLAFDLLTDEITETPVECPYPGYIDKPIEFASEVLGAGTLTAEIEEVMLSVRDNPVTEARSANAMGKTHGAAHVAAWWYQTRSYAQVYTTAAPPEGNLKRLLWGEINKLVQRNPVVFENDIVTSLNIQRGAVDFITGVTIPTSGTSEARESKFSGKHAAHILFIVDEGDAVPPEVYKGIESCMSGGNARLLILFNPRHKSGPVWTKERDGQANVISLCAFNHPNVVTGQDVMPGAVTREATVRRVNEWSRLLTPDEKRTPDCFDLPEYLVGSTATSLDGQRTYPPLPEGTRIITDPALSYMVLGQYPAQGVSQLINERWIYNARARWDAYVSQHGEVPPAGTRPILAGDIAELGDDLNIALLRYGGFVPRLRHWGGVETDETEDKLIGIWLDVLPILTCIDATGVGVGIAPRMRRVLRKRVPQYTRVTPIIGVKVAWKPTKKTELGVFKILRDQLLWEVREWLAKDPGAMLPPDDFLIEELLTPTYEVKKEVRVMAKEVMKEKLGRSPDRLDALALSFYDGSAQRPDAQDSALARAMKSKGLRRR